MKYQLLLRDVYKYTERAGLSTEIETLKGAIAVMQVVPKAANDMMDVGRLQGFDVSIEFFFTHENNYFPSFKSHKS